MRTRPAVCLPPLEDEFSSAKLGRSDRNRRAVEIATKVSEAPAKSFPQLFRDPSELEGVYRFFTNKHFDAERLVSGHLDQTAERIRAVEGRVLALHDSTELRYFGEREGLGYLKNGQGLLFHPTLAIAPERERPLGLINFQVLKLEEPEKGLSKAERQKKSRATPREEKACIRWDDGVFASEKRLGEPGKLVHVMDQEGDSFALLCNLAERGCRFIIRGQLGRTVDGRGGEKVEEVLEAAPLFLKRQVPLSARPAKQKGRTASRNNCQPVRKARTASLEVRACSMERKRPNYAQTETRSLPLNVVHVRETQPPKGEQPVEWLLYTTESIAGAADVAWAVDGYCARWCIEEYFKALKTGCAVEKRQLTSGEKLEKVIALFAPIAWRLLLLRTLSRENPDLPATEVFDGEALVVLRVLLGKYKLPEAPTVLDVYLAIANLGGHLKRNGPPGWQTLGAGHDELLRGIAIARALRAAPT